MLLLLLLARGPRSGTLMPGSRRPMSVRFVTPEASSDWLLMAEML